MIKIYSFYRSLYVLILCQIQLQADQSQHIQDMKRQLVRSQAPQNNTRRSSVHFQYESEEEPSRVQNPRGVDYSCHQISSDSDQTIKTTNFYSNRFNESSLSGFDAPVFSVGIDPKDFNNTHVENGDQEQFWNFLEKFGKDSESSSIEDVNFEEVETVYHKSSVAHRKDSEVQNPFIKQLKSDTKVSQFQLSKEKQQDKDVKFLIKESNEQESSKNCGKLQSTSLNMRTNVDIFTQTSNKRENIIRRQREPQISIFKNLTFKKFGQAEQESDIQRRYPVRFTRQCNRLKYWQFQKIDYGRKGYWIQKDD